jgi:hypothetical protein
VHNLFESKRLIKNEKTTMDARALLPQKANPKQPLAIIKYSLLKKLG